MLAVVHMLRETAGLRRSHTGSSMRTRLPIDKARFRPNPQNSIDGDDFGCGYLYGQCHMGSNRVRINRARYLIYSVIQE